MNLAPASCCCGCAIDCECLASTYTLSYPAITFTIDECVEGSCSIVTVTVPATTVTVYRCCYTYEPCGTGGPTTDNVIYRSNPVALPDLEYCCPITGGNTCVTLRAWVVFALAAECTYDCESQTSTFSGWQVSGVVVSERFNSSTCEVCTDPIPRDISSDGCLGFDNTYYPIELFTGTNTCPGTGSVVQTFGGPVSMSHYDPSDPSDPCDPTGSYSVCDTDTSPPCTLTATVS